MDYKLYDVMLLLKGKERAEETRRPFSSMTNQLVFFGGWGLASP